MGIKAREKRKIRPDGDSFVVGLLHHELQELGLIVEAESGEWELVDDGLEAWVASYDDERKFEVQLPDDVGRPTAD